MIGVISATQNFSPNFIKELDIFPNLDTIAALDQRRKHGNEGKGNAMGAQGPGL
jgi:hypothetical protein